MIRSEGGGGLYLHPVVAVDAGDGAILGLVHGCFLDRGEGKAGDRRTRVVAGKESQRWLDGAAQAAAVCASAASLTVVADRESDIYGAFALRPPGCDLLVRAAHDRALEDGGHLFAASDALPVAGRADLHLPAGPGRAARTAALAVRFMRARLKRPRHGLVDGLPPSVAMTLVDVREVDPPAGQAGVHWRLITSHGVADAADALAIADLYRRRWAIEQVFRTMKTKGFDIEGVRIAEATPLCRLAILCRLAMATLIAALTIQQLVHARDGTDGTPPEARRSGR